MALNITTNLINTITGYLLDAVNVKGTYLVVQNYSKLSPAETPALANTVINGSLAYCQSEVTISNVTYPVGFYQYDGSAWVEANLGGGLFECTYNSTTYEEVTGAINSGLLPYVTYNNLIHLYGGFNSGIYRFVAIWNSSLSYVTLTNADVWENGSVVYENVENKITAFSGQPTDDQYPSAKLIYDQLISIQDALEALTISDIDAIWSDGYPITVSITNGTGQGTNKILFTDVSITIIPNSGYEIPESITVTNADYTYDEYTGMVTLNNATGNVTITAVCEATPVSNEEV